MEKNPQYVLADEWDYEEAELIDSETPSIIVGGEKGKSPLADLTELESLAMTYPVQAGMSQSQILEEIKGSKTSAFAVMLMAADNEAEKYAKKPEHLSVIDARIRAMMMVCESFEILEGDIKQAIIAPMEIGFTGVDVVCEDKTARKEAEDLMAAIDLEAIMQDTWHTTQIYGQSHVLPTMDGESVDRLMWLNPKNVGIGPQVLPYGRVTTFVGADPGSKSFESYQALLTQVAEEQQEEWMQYLDMGPDWNEKLEGLGIIAIPPGRVVTTFAPKHRHQKHAIPPLMGASRAITTRMVLEEMVRGTIEGIRGQLWVFTLENPRRGEIRKLGELINSHRADRTGWLAWRSGLEVEQHLPGTIDGLLAPETYWNLTKDIFRRIGITMRLISGESPSEAGRAQDAEIDISVYLARIEYHRKQIEKMGNHILGLHNAGSNGWQKAKPRLRFSQMAVRQEQQIRDRMGPLWDRGLLSPQRALEMVGEDYENILAEKQDAEPEMDLFGPPSIYKQEAVKEGGETTTTELKGPSKGRPKKGDVKMAAAVDIRTVLERYHDSVRAAWDETTTRLAATDDRNEREERILAFIAVLAHLNAMYRRQAYQDGYIAGGGRGLADTAEMERVIAWDDAYRSRLEADLVGRVGMEDPKWGSFRYRIGMYATEGYKVAFMAGLFQAKREQQWTHWQRVLRPWASKEGPCDLCVADSRVIHPITTDFFEPHPNGVCGMQFITFWSRAEGDVSGVVPGPTLEVPGNEDREEE